MAQFDGLTKAKAEAIIGASVASATINGQGHLILTRNNGQTIDAGDFTGIVSGLLVEAVNDAVATGIYNALAGAVTVKNGVTGVMTFDEFSTASLMNAIIIANLTGNVTLNSASFPANPKAGTRFRIRFKQDATGGRTLTLIGIKRGQSDEDGQLDVRANGMDLFEFFYDGTNWWMDSLVRYVI